MQGQNNVKVKYAQIEFLEQLPEMWFVLYNFNNKTRRLNILLRNKN